MASKTANTEKLKKIFAEKGCFSEEFYEQVRLFVVFLQYRFTGFYDEDLQSHCILKIFESMKYYTGEINIASWCFSVVRNQCSSFLYRKQKSLRNDDISDMELPELEQPPSGEFTHEDQILEPLKQMEKLEVVIPEGDLLEDFNLMEKENPLFRFALWHKIMAT